MDIDYRRSGERVVNVTMVFYALALLGTFGIIIWQVVASVQKGQIVWWSFITALDWLGLEWAKNPQSFNELYAVLWGAPLAFGYIFVVGGIGWLIERLLVAPKRSLR